MQNCNSNIYIISHVDIRKNSITVPKSTLLTDVYDIAIVGKTRLEYGEIFNENVLHLLEHFASPEDPLSDEEYTFPHFNSVTGRLLEKPIEGQMWYNKTKKIPYVYEGARWIPLQAAKNISGSMGVLKHGDYLPQPIDINGNAVPYSKCKWAVSPYEIEDNCEYMVCSVTVDGRIRMFYYKEGTNQNPTYRITGKVNYHIVGIA